MTPELYLCIMSIGQTIGFVLFSWGHSRRVIKLAAEIEALRADRDRALYTNVDLFMENIALRAKLHSLGYGDPD